MTTNDGHTTTIVGVRLDHNGPVVFCRYDEDVSAARPALARGQRVRVDLGRDAAPREGVVVIAPEQIIVAPPLDGAPRAVAALPPDDAEPGGGAVVGLQGAAIDPLDPIMAPVGDADLARTSLSGGDANLAPAFLPADDADLVPMFLPADDADLTLADLARALRLAALPLPEAPPQRERDGERQGR